MSVETAVVEEGVNPAQSPLVAVTFQGDANRKLKYLEAKPKALGITQIGLVLFQMNFVIVFVAKGVMKMENLFPQIPFFIGSTVVVIAGSVAVAARNLHVPTLKACLGMQIVACLLSMFNILVSMDMVSYLYFDCWREWDSETIHFRNICDIVGTTNINVFAELVILDVVLVGISITLARYCCKAIGCCGSPARTPMIALQAPPVQQQGEEANE